MSTAPPAADRPAVLHPLLPRLGLAGPAGREGRQSRQPRKDLRRGLGADEARDGLGLGCIAAMGEGGKGGWLGRQETTGCKMPVSNLPKGGRCSTVEGRPRGDI